MTATQDDMIADLQRSVAELRRERDAALAELQARTAALAQRNSEYDERLEHQSATIDVLKVMSASPSDPQPVFDLIVRRASELCNVPTATLFEYDGEMVHWRSSYGIESVALPDPLETYLNLFPIAPTRGSISCRAILDRETVHVRDLSTDPTLADFVRRLGHRSQVSVPLLRQGTAVGAISIGANGPGGFTDNQIALLQTFAEQAVIAITSAETYRALQDRTSDLQETLEYQTATSDVLKVISRSTFDLQPVLDTVVEAAARLCTAEQAVIIRREGELMQLAANHGFPPEYEALLSDRGPIPIDRAPRNVGPRAIREGRVVHVHDAATEPGYTETAITLGKQRTSLGVPLLREGEVIGSILLARQCVEPFTDRQIELVSTFADQAVIAIENTRLLTEQREALEQQTATAEVLQLLNVSPGNLAPVFDAMLQKALTLCGAAFGQLVTFDGSVFRAAAWRGYEPGPGATAPAPGMALYQLVHGEQIVHIPDITADEVYRSGNPVRRRLADDYGGRTAIWVALRNDEKLLGAFVIYRTEVRSFSVKQITLLQNFAAQAVIAMENARLITETREALEQQTATAEVLQVINSSPGDLAPVFEAILQKAKVLCEADMGTFWTFDGERFFPGVISRDHPLDRGGPTILGGWQPGPHVSLGRVMAGEDTVHVVDVSVDTGYQSDATARARTAASGTRSALTVALRTEGRLLGAITTARKVVRPYSEQQIELLRSFAAQAVIAMENARLLDEIRQRQEELRITFENMGDGVALFDETRHLVASNRQFQDMLDVPDDVILSRPAFADYIRFLADRGEYGPDPEEHVAHLLTLGRQQATFERMRPNGRSIEIRSNPVPSGGFVVIYSDITERKRNEQELRAARDAAEEASRTIEAAYRDLKAAQASLIQAEKMASLGQLTAGIAHEIKNPLNFVNNFAELSVDLLDELNAAVANNQRAEVKELTGTLKGNLGKIAEHGRRADGIVRGMLEHSRGSSGERRSVDVNVLVDEALNLAYHGARAQDQSFNVVIERDFGDGISPVTLAPQDVTRVLLNLLSNGFYAARERQRMETMAGFEPTLKVSTRELSDAVEIRVRDNGIGIPAEIKDRLFQPFFTTKPPGEGTGLGLSMSYDIITQQHGGSITVDSKIGEYSEFAVRLPRKP